MHRWMVAEEIIGLNGCLKSQIYSLMLYKSEGRLSPEEKTEFKRENGSHIITCKLIKNKYSNFFSKFILFLV